MSSPLPILDDLLAQQALNGAIALAFDNQLFDFLNLPANAAQVAEHCGWRSAPVEHLLRLLWSSELLSREGENYFVASDARQYLCRAGERYIGAAWRYRHQTLQQFVTRLPQLLQQAAPGWHDPLQIDTAWADAALHQIAQEQRALSADTACAIADKLADFQRPALLLDMGGGPGLIAIALAQRFPHLSAVVLDLPQTATVAQRNIERAGLTDRCCALAQFAENRQVDIIWSSSFLYFIEDREAMLRKWFEQLRPGGLLISAHAEVPCNPADARRILPFFTPLMMRGYSVTQEGELALQLQQVGFVLEQEQRLQPFPMSPLYVLLARKPKTSD
ncbi:class I SAM-dependent methyltransferase [Pantoea sp. S18]|uniref:class I SAM-dependent methyltransferase n=1 Tax=Pantoea sp. S18 TaxID=3019892 RepID=UPI002B216131|nr:class I SAM-dependent methyltransferase [Pantoea sp. S18]MEA5101090.1 class I SAM-dependent methyltransferase [Pantoea sp. S18]